MVLLKRVWFAGALTACAGVVLLKALPYSTSWITRVDDVTAEERPGDEYRLGNLVWRLPDFKAASSLEPFRQAFGPSCGGQRGVEAARCVSQVLMAKSPTGVPRNEFVDERYDPAVALKVHLAGAPGHCTTRSALTATALLAMGIPARVVQLIPAAGDGHNVVGVWDDARGWVTFDALFGSTINDRNGPASSVEIASANGGLLWGGSPKGDAPDPNHYAGATVVYPEPWLYTRVGERCAQWPFRGCFSKVGPSSFLLGNAQRLTLAFGFLGGLLAMLSTLAMAMRRLRPLRRESDVSVTLPVGVETPRS